MDFFSSFWYLVVWKYFYVLKLVTILFSRREKKMYVSSLYRNSKALEFIANSFLVL